MDHAAEKNRSLEQVREQSSSRGSKSSQNNGTCPKPDATSVARRETRFYAILAAICLAGALTALEGTITSTTLPTIAADLGGGKNYIWVANGYLIAMTAIQPMSGQLANIFGRRWPTLASVAIFVLGSGICGGANSIGMLIAGRVVQGIGAGSINVLIEIIVCDLVPLRQRSQFTGLIFGMIAIGTALGPLFGGLIVQNTTWRWVFYLNLPIGGLALAVLALTLKVNWNREKTLGQKISQIDVLGNIIFVAAVSSILIALSWAGAAHPWSSYQVIVPLVVGVIGLGVFTAFEASPLAPMPTMPLRLFANRTSATVFAVTFLNSIVTLWGLYFLPIYFQGVLGSSPSRSGVQLLPTIFLLVVSAVIGGVSMTKFGRYRPLHHISFAIVMVGFGLFSLLGPDSSTGYWVGFQIVQALGVGMVIPTLLPAVLAPLTEVDTAVATATWSFMRSFGVVWGAAIPAAIFNNRFDQLAPGQISDTNVLNTLLGGQAYEHATKAYLNTLSPETRRQFMEVVAASLRLTWYVGIGFAALGLLLVSIEREIPLREELETEFGLEDKMKTKGSSGEAETSPESLGQKESA